MVRISKQQERRQRCPKRPAAPVAPTGPREEARPFNPHVNAAPAALAQSFFIPKIK